MDFEIDDAVRRVDREAVWQWLSTEARWSRWRSREQFEQQIDNAWRIVGAYERPRGRQLGFARAFSDGVGSAYLADVIVLPDARGKGIGKALVRAMIDDGPGRDFRWMLHTDDAHGLYEPFGFARPDHTYLERRRGTGSG